MLPVNLNVNRNSLLKKVITFICLSILCFEGNSTKVDSLKFNKSLEQFHRFKFSNTDSAKFYLDQLDVLSQSDLRSPQRYRYYIVFGGWTMVKREITPAISSYKKALELAKDLKNGEFIVKSKFNLGTAYGEVGDYAKAIALFKDVEAGLDEIKTDRMLFSNQFRANMVQFYTQTKDVEEAFKYSNDMRSNLKTYTDSTMFYMSRFHLLSSSNKNKELIILGSEVLKKLKVDDLHFRYQVYVWMANSYIELSKYEEAMKYLLKAKELSLELGIESGVVESSLGYLYIQTKDYKNAINQFSRTLTLAQKQGIAGSERTAVKSLADVYKKQGNSKESLKYLERYIILNDSILGVEKIKAIKDAEARYELNDKEKTITQQAQLNDLQKALLKEEYQRRYILIVFLVLSLIFGLTLGFAFRKASRANKQLIFQRNQIEEYAAELKKANQMRDKLFAMISHDLKSPVTNLVSSLESSESGKSLSSITNALNNVQHILNNLLKWAQLQLTFKPFRAKEVHLDSLVRNILKQFDSTITEKKIQVLNNFKGSKAVWADEESLLIAVRNILSNAIKFTSENGIIRISIEEETEFVSLNIRDSGIGLTALQLETLFAYPESRNGTLGETGTGLGMTLTKDLITQMNGSISVKSKEGIGTQVSVKLPVKRVA